MSTMRSYGMRLASAVAGTLLLISCDSGGFVNSDPTQAATPTSVQLDSVPANLARDDTVLLGAKVLDENGTPMPGLPVDWSSSDPKVASVEPTSASKALLAGVDQGTATITASYNQLSASISVEVHRRPTDLVYVSGSGQAGTAGEQLPDSLVIRAVDRRGDPVSGVDVSFVVTSGGGSVSPANGFTDMDGFLSAAWTLGSSSQQQVQARASEAQQRVQQLKDSVVVFNATTGAAVVGLAVLPDSATVSVGDSLQFEAMATTSDGSQTNDGQVAWESTDTTVATISPKGMLHGRKSGATGVVAKTTQTATGSEIADTTQVNVASTASTLGTLHISSPDTLRGIGDTLTLTVQARAADGTLISSPDVQWSSLNPDIATVDTMGKVTSKALGTALITAVSLCCSPDTAGLVVAAATTGTITISPADTLRGVGDTLTLTAKARASDGSQVANPAIQWSSLNPKIATVDTTGMVTSHALGNAVVTAASDCCATDSTTVSVVAGDPATVNDLHVTSVTTSSVTLTWTQVDDGTGQPANYAIRYGSPTLSWGSAYATEVDVNGTAIGNSLTYTYSGVTPATDYQFALVSYRGTLNADAVFGSMSNVTSATTNAGTPGPITKVTATPSSITFSGLGQTAQITAVATDSAGLTIDTATFNYSSTKPSVVSVDDMGKTTAMGLGSALIMVTSACCGAGDTISATVDTTQASAVFSDNFESYADGADIAGGGNSDWTWGTAAAGAHTATVTTDIARSGTKSLKFHWNGGPQTQEAENFTHTPATHGWYEFYLYFPDGTEGLGPAYHQTTPGEYGGTAGNNKFFTFWPTSYSTGSPGGNPSGVIQLWGMGGYVPDGTINIGRSDPLTGDTRYSDTNSGMLLLQYHGWPSVKDGADLGRWIRVRFEFKVADVGKNNGILRFWADDKLLWETTTEPFYDFASGTGKYNFISQGYIFGAADSWLEPGTNIYLDDFKFYTSDPGW